jgi:hypothetical protein
MPSTMFLSRSLSAAAVVAVLGLAACDSDPPAADANPGDLVDAPGGATDGPPADGPIGCDPDQMCFAYNAIDGVTDLPPGRLVIAWIPPESGPDDAPAQVGYDGEWTTAVTALDLAAITIPDAAHLTTFLPCGEVAHFGVALGLIGTDLDPNGDGSISVDEINAASVYGIFQEALVYADVTCPPGPDSPTGTLMGVHVYDERQGVLDGVPTETQTCSPGTAACDQLDDPL